MELHLHKNEDLFLMEQRGTVKDCEIPYNHQSQDRKKKTKSSSYACGASYEWGERSIEESEIQETCSWINQRVSCDSIFETNFLFV